jgi:hypothetical protein
VELSVEACAVRVKILEVGDEGRYRGVCRGGGDVYSSFNRSDSADLGVRAG